MATAVKPTTDHLIDGTEVEPSLFPDAPARTRAPSLKRPDDVSDSEWAIMSAAKNEDVHKRIADIISGESTPTAEEAAVLMEIVVGAERAAFMTIVKLRRDLAPKIKAAGDVATTLGDIKMRLFRFATGRADAS